MNLRGFLPPRNVWINSGPKILRRCLLYWVVYQFDGYSDFFPSAVPSWPRFWWYCLGCRYIDIRWPKFTEFWSTNVNVSAITLALILSYQYLGRISLSHQSTPFNVSLRIGIILCGAARKQSLDNEFEEENLNLAQECELSIRKLRLYIHVV